MSIASGKVMRSTASILAGGVILVSVLLAAPRHSPAPESTISLIAGERESLDAHPTIAPAPHPDDKGNPFENGNFWFVAAGAVAGLFLVFAVLLVWNRVLKSLVDQKTRELREELAERKLAEESLARAEARYRGIFEKATEGIFQSSPNGQFIEVNPAMAGIFGYDSPEEMVSAVRDIGTHLYGNPSLRARVVGMIEEQGTVSFQGMMHKKDGGTGWVSVSVRAVRDNDGNTCCYEGIAEDITELKEREAELREARNQLARESGGTDGRIADNQRRPAAGNPGT